MTRLTDYTSYADAQRHCSPSALWALFDGGRESLNIAHECVDRYV
jgi:acetyl-CoA synthetase